MPFPLKSLLEGRRRPTCIRQDQTVREAIQLLLGNDFNQLPVVDQNGYLLGVISEQTILRTYYHSGGAVPLFDLPVSHCQEPVVTLSAESDMIDALDLLNDRDNYCIVVVDNRIQIGILTHYDMTNFFRLISEGQIYVESIELTLRQHIDTLFPDEASMKAGLIAAFGLDKNDKTKPARDYEYMGFMDHIQMITDEDNWPKFQNVFEPKELFRALMNQARVTRNLLAHYRGHLDALQYDGLKLAVHWLETRPKLVAPQDVPPRPAKPAGDQVGATTASDTSDN